MFGRRWPGFKWIATCRERQIVLQATLLYFGEIATKNVCSSEEKSLDIFSPVGTL